MDLKKVVRSKADSKKNVQHSRRDFWTWPKSVFYKDERGQNFKEFEGLPFRSLPMMNKNFYNSPDNLSAMTFKSTVSSTLTSLKLIFKRASLPSLFGRGI